MATNHPAAPSPESAIMSNATADEQDDSIRPLMDRLASVIHRLKLAADDLRELAITRPAEQHGSAAFVIAEATGELNRLYKDFDAWASAHDFTQKDMQHLLETQRRIAEVSDDTADVLIRGQAVLSASEVPWA